MLSWLAVHRGTWPSPAWIAATFWHAHEMLLGFAGAVMAGFLVTRATPSKILLLAFFWLLGRAAFWIPSPAASLLLLPFPALLALLVAPAFFRSARKTSNLAFGLVPVGLLLLEGLFVLAALDADAVLAGRIVRTQVLLVALLLVLMGGRIVRAATAGLLQRRDGRLVAGVDLRGEVLTLLSFSVALAGTLLPLPSPLAGVSLTAAGLITAWRLARWFTPAVGEVAELRALHAGYAWLAAGLLLLGLGGLLPVFRFADVVHAVTIGGLGTLAFTVMARTAAQRAGLGFRAAASVARWAPLAGLAALARLAVPLSPNAAPALLALSAVLWSWAFLLLAVFLLGCTRSRLSAVVDGEPGRGK